MSKAITCGAIVAAIASTASAAEDTHHSANLQLLHTTDSRADPVNGTGTSDRRLTTFRFDYFGVHGLGDNYLFIDNYLGKDVGVAGARNQQYVSFMPVASLSKLTGKEMTFGLISDISLGGRFDYASYGDFHANAFGPSFDLRVPGFDWMRLRLLWQESKFDGRKLFTQLAWGSTYPIGSRRLHFDGYFWTRKKDDGSRQWHGETDLSLDLDPQGVVQAGLRLSFAKYRGYSRTTPHLLTKLNF